MLCLTRKQGEVILVGDDIRIVVRRIGQKGSRPYVQLAIQAPSSTRIDREEVRERIAVEGLREVNQGLAEMVADGEVERVGDKFALRRSSPTNGSA